MLSLTLIIIIVCCVLCFFFFLLSHCFVVSFSNSLYRVLYTKSIDCMYMLHRFYCAHIPLLGFCLCIFFSFSFYDVSEVCVCMHVFVYIFFLFVYFFFFKFHYEIFIAATLLLSLFSSTVFGVIFLCWFIWFIHPSIHSHKIANQISYANRRSVKFLIYSFIIILSLFFNGIFGYSMMATFIFSFINWK